MKKTALLITIWCLAALGVMAQTENEVPVLTLSAETGTIDYMKQMVLLKVSGNTDYTAASDVEWMRLRKEGDRLTLTVEANWTGDSRYGTVTVKSVNGNCVRTFTLTQTRERLADYVSDGRVYPTSSSDNNNNGTTVRATQDDNIQTVYHSHTGGDVTDKKPAVLTFNFKNEHLDYVTYMPRQRGIWLNGCFGRFAIFYRTTGSTEYTLVGNYDLEKQRLASTIYFGENGLDSVASVKMEVYSGYNEYSDTIGIVSCAEMVFGRNLDTKALFPVFADNLLTTLKPGVTQADIDAVENPYAKVLAQQLFDGTYSTEYRVHQFPCRVNHTLITRTFMAQGIYDACENVTGIYISKGKSMVIVEGAADESQLTLEVYGWTVSEGKTFDYVSYGLHNGVNIINHKLDWDGLAYVDYNNKNPEACGDIKVHFVNGTVNGYLSMDKTNAEMEEIVKKAKYTTIDLVGDRVHLVWETKALLKYATGKYRQHINTIDTIIGWEHKLLGMEKYNRVPKNRVLGYVNYDYYMGMGGLGISFKHDQQRRILDPTNVMKNDLDVVWGLSHEWGHLHQMTPYFNWPGLGECSNNMNSCYNSFHMGYACNNVKNEWAMARTQFFNSDPKAGKVSKMRSNGYKRANQYKFSQPMYEAYLAMADSVITARADDPLHALQANEGELGARLSGFYMLHAYMESHGYPDFYPDLYEALRHTETDEDKYSLVAAAQYAKRDRYKILKAKYPESTWVKDNCVNMQSTAWQNAVPYILNFVRKASLTSGYNMMPYFEAFGWLRTVALYVDDDYGQKYYCMTKGMYDEFKADMDALVADGTLQVMPDTMISDIVNQPMPKFTTPKIPN